MADGIELAARPAFAGLLAPIGPSPARVKVAERRGLRLAVMEVRKGRAEALSQRVQTRYGLTLPWGPRRASSGAIDFLGVGPGRWLAIGADDLSEALGEAASVIDQSDGLAVLRISGPSTRAAFAKGLPIDLDASAFAEDAVAASALAHIGVTLWRRDDATTFEVALYRSLAGDFAQWLREAAAEFGLALA